ncbi:Bidirectional sugar transporter sweet5 [Turnera subulata]|uniref:Bidirectional sugar transporter SWEET n=1 Tax=Turnera subulata TaxID=218843 RepID=A0A9Q0G8G0_9ROSI|nr:Bidirectional sugar transporter sweet5 [Turnera subulata]
MTDTETTRTIVGILGNIISFFLFLSPVPTFATIIKDKAVHNFKPHPYVATVLNCMMWSFYGLPFVKPDSILVLTINAIGLAMEIVYVIIFFTYSPNKLRIKITVALLCEIGFMAAVVLITMLCFHTTGKRSMFVGILCIIFNIIMYASPLAVMKMVIKSKSVKYMPFTLSLANFLNGCIWVVYAFLKFDINIFLPNCLGTMSGLVQLILYACYYKTTRWDEEDEEPKDPEVEMTGRP